MQNRKLIAELSGAKTRRLKLLQQSFFLPTFSQKFVRRHLDKLYVLYNFLNSLIYIFEYKHHPYKYENIALADRQ